MQVFMDAATASTKALGFKSPAHWPSARKRKSIRPAWPRRYGAFTFVPYPELCCCPAVSLRARHQGPGSSHSRQPAQLQAFW